MLPWIFAYVRNNYARYLTVYWCEMTLLPQIHPYANTLLENGQFAVQRSPHGAFAQVPVDQTIEQMMNRDSKTKRGIVGISLDSHSFSWILDSGGFSQFMTGPKPVMLQSLKRVPTTLSEPASFLLQLVEST